MLQMKHFHEKNFTLEFSVETAHQFKLLFLIAPILLCFNLQLPYQEAFIQGLQTDFVHFQKP